jgi:hypothetical protein
MKGKDMAAIAGMKQVVENYSCPKNPAAYICKDLVPGA